MTKADYESLVKTAITDKALDGKYKACLTTISRLRTAWRMAQAELDRLCARQTSGAPPVDYDMPLNDEEEKQRSEDWNKAYDNLAIDRDMMAAATWHKTSLHLRAQITRCSGKFTASHCNCPTLLHGNFSKDFRF